MNMKRRLALSIFLFTFTSLVAVVLPAGAAHAATTSATFVYNGSNNDSRTLADTHLLYFSGCDGLEDPATTTIDPVTCLPDGFPGSVWFRIRVGVNSTAVTAQTAGFLLTNSDNVHQGQTAPFTTTLNAVDAAGKEVTVRSTPFVELDVAYDAPLANCPANTITTDAGLDAADTSGCLNAVYHSGQMSLGTFTLLAQDGILPYGGTANFSQTTSSPTLDIGDLAFGVGGILGLKIDFVTNMALTALAGYNASHTITASSSPGTPLLSGPINWPNSNPQSEQVLVPCSTPVGDTLTYGLTNNRWDGTGAATAGASLVITNPVSDIHIPIVGGVTVFNAGVQATTPDFSALAGTVLADNVAPTITAITQSGLFVEGSDITFTAVASDNCSAALDYEWRFSDGGVGFNSTTHHTFADNGNYTLDLRVTDAAGNGTSTDKAVNTITNANPAIAPPLPDASAEWGVPVQFHADAVDPGPADQPTLVFRWDFGDRSNAAGADVSHAYATPGSYTVNVTVRDKDGGLGTGTLTAVIAPRATTITYTGATQSLPSKYVTVSATLVDDLGQPVAGRNVAFILGTQGASGATDSSGALARTIKLSQKQGSYLVGASFAGDSKYLASSDTDTFVIGH